MKCHMWVYTVPTIWKAGIKVLYDEQLVYSTCFSNSGYWTEVQGTTVSITCEGFTVLWPQFMHQKVTSHHTDHNIITLLSVQQGIQLCFSFESGRRGRKQPGNGLNPNLYWFSLYCLGFMNYRKSEGVSPNIAAGFGNQAGGVNAEQSNVVWRHPPSLIREEWHRWATAGICCSTAIKQWHR